jgi:hypothetical protein
MSAFSKTASVSPGCEPISMSAKGFSIGTS